MKRSLLKLIVCILIVAVVIPSTVAVNSSVAEERSSAENSSSRAWSIVATYAIPEGASGLAYDGTYLYCGIYGANGDEVYRINPANGSYSLYCSGPQGDAFGMTWDGTYLWTTDHPGSSSDPAVAIQFDASGSQVSSFNLPDHYMSGIAYDNDSFWVATYYPDPSTIYKVDGSGNVVKQFTAPDNQPWDLCMQDGYLWMADYWGDALYKIDTLDGSLIESHASEGVDPAGIVWDGAFLWYCDNGEGGNDYLYKVDLSGAGTPAIYVYGTEHDYGTVTIGDTQPWDVTVENVGTADLEITGVSFSGSEDLGTTTSFPITLSPTDQASLSIVWSPTGFGDLDATATVESNDPIHPGVDIALTGSAVYPGPDINLPTTSHDYGTVRDNAYTRWFIDIENLGDTPLTISNITSDDVHFIPNPDLEYPFDIDVLGSRQIGVWFNPETNISYSATITITSNDPDENPVYVSVQGEGLETDYPMGTSLWNYLIDEGYDNSPKAIAPIPDVTGDGVDDVIICSEDDYVRCFNGNSHGIADVIWEHEIYAGPVYSQNGLVITEDVNYDSHPDVVVASAWGGKLVRTISGKNGEEIWTYNTDEYGDGGWVYQVDCQYDYNGDGVRDVLACAGDDATDTGPKRAYCLNGITGAKIWERPLAGPVFSIIGVEDFTGDGQADAVAGASNEDETMGRVVGLNGETGLIEWTYDVNGTSVWALAQIDDITGDGVRDVAAGDFGGTSYVYGLDATDGGEEFVRSGFGIILRIEILDDVNANGYRDIAASHSSTSLRVIDGLDGEIIWMQTQPDKVWNVRRTPDISGDGINDLMVGTLYSSNYCLFIDGTDGEQLHSEYYGTPVDALGAIPDIVGDGSWEMVAGGRDGTVYCLSGGLDAVENDPPATPTSSGPTAGITGIEYTYTFMSTDPDADELFYYIEWGDGNVEDWIGPYPSGADVVVAHTWTGAGVFSVRAKARDVYTAQSAWSDPLLVDIVLDNEPPSAPILTGPTTGNPEIEYAYGFTSVDPDGDSVFLYIEWGDGNVEDWIGPFASGEEAGLSHAWAEIGEYNVRAKARDADEAESAWSDVLTVDITFVCGDTDASGDVDIDDVVYIIAFIFTGGPEPNPYLSGDADCSGLVDIDDAVFLIAYIFSGGYDPCDTDGDFVPDC
jgi:hypothetical protein